MKLERIFYPDYAMHHLLENQAEVGGCKTNYNKFKFWSCFKKIPYLNKDIKLSVSKKYRKKSIEKGNIFTSSIWKINLKQKDNKNLVFIQVSWANLVQSLPNISSALKKKISKYFQT